MISTGTAAAAVATAGTTSAATSSRDECGRAGGVHGVRITFIKGLALPRGDQSQGQS